jgi:YHS domain-containing protein
MPPGGGSPARRPEGDEMVQDPQCKVYVPVSRAVKKTFGGNTMYFCSEDCARNFLKKID